MLCFSSPLKTVPQLRFWEKSRETSDNRCPKSIPTLGKHYPSPHGASNHTITNIAGPSPRFSTYKATNRLFRDPRIAGRDTNSQLPDSPPVSATIPTKISTVAIILRPYESFLVNAETHFSLFRINNNCQFGRRWSRSAFHYVTFLISQSRPIRKLE